MISSKFIVAFTCLLALASAHSLSSRIFGGHNAQLGQFPHQVSLQLTWPQQGLRYSHFCGGSILNDQWIVTAARCLVQLKNAYPDKIFTVKAGIHDLNNLSEETEQKSRIQQFFIHERYDKNAALGASPYDIGLIKLQSPLKLNERVAAIALPEKNSEPTGKVTLSGWGAVNDDSVHPELPDILQTVDLEIVDRASCNRDLVNVYQQKGVDVSFDLVQESNVCTKAITGFASTCTRDDGSPLISKASNGKTELVGVVSWGVLDCGRKGAPSVYARTSFFVDWIQNIIANN